MDKATNTPPRELLDRHGNHYERHGTGICHVLRHGSAATQRNASALQVSTEREARVGGRTLVFVSAYAAPASCHMAITPDDVAALIEYLTAAMVRAREVDAELQRQGYTA